MTYAKHLDRRALYAAVWAAEFTRSLGDATRVDVRIEGLKVAKSPVILRHLAKRAADDADRTIEAIRLLLDVELRRASYDELDDCYMPWEQFVAACRSGALTDDNGHGELATDDHHVSNVRIYPSTAIRDDHDRPNWATHVCWYNK